jgi:hypothetical protein
VLGEEPNGIEENVRLQFARQKFLFEARVIAIAAAVP